MDFEIRGTLGIQGTQRRYSRASALQTKQSARKVGGKTTGAIQASQKGKTVSSKIICLMRSFREDADLEFTFAYHLHSSSTIFSIKVPF
jgi:hypothetical protein